MDIKYRNYLILPIGKREFYAYEPNSLVAIVGSYKSVAKAEKGIDAHIAGGNKAVAVLLGQSPIILGE